MDKLTAFNVFVTVVERGSFTDASESLGITRSMVSRYVSHLEEWLDTRLLHRSTRQLSLTEAGRDCLARAHEVLGLTNTLQEEISGKTSALQGTLKLTSAVSFGNLILTPIVGEFLNEHPGINIELALSDRSTNLIQEGIDLAITMTHELDPNCIAHSLAECHSVLTASPAYLEANEALEKIEDISSHNCLRHAYFGTDTWSFKRADKTLELPVSGNFLVDDALTLGHAALKGTGIALLPAYVAKPHLASGDLITLFDEYTPPSVGIYGVYRSRSYTPNSLKQLLLFIQRKLNHTL